MFVACNFGNKIHTFCKFGYYEHVNLWGNLHIRDFAHRILTIFHSTYTCIGASDHLCACQRFHYTMKNRWGSDHRADGNRADFHHLDERTPCRLRPPGKHLGLVNGRQRQIPIGGTQPRNLLRTARKHVHSIFRSCQPLSLFQIWVLNNLPFCQVTEENGRLEILSSASTILHHKKLNSYSTHIHHTLIHHFLPPSPTHHFNPFRLERRHHHHNHHHHRHWQFWIAIIVICIIETITTTMATANV